jgi:GMP synthase-like glutamine amidotransferase
VTRRIAFLNTCNDASDFAARWPRDGEKIRALVAPLRPDWELADLHAYRGILPSAPDSYDGYIVGGSPASVNDPDDWVASLLGFLRAVHAAQKPMVGLCFGHQAIARALGGAVGFNPGGWELGCVEVGFERRGPWAEPARERLALIASHREEVSRLPEGAVVTGRSRACPVGGFTLGTTVLTTQYHPELTAPFLADLLGEFGGTVPEATLAAARASLARPQEGPLFAAWMVRFLDGAA